jgi:outer membrane protein OmpA-like peptidoglycan-associated protein
MGLVCTPGYIAIQLCDRACSSRAVPCANDAASGRSGPGRLRALTYGRRPPSCIAWSSMATAEKLSHMNTKKSLLLATIVLTAASSAALFAQPDRVTPAIASSDVLSQISMFSYRDGPKSDLRFRGTPIAALAEGDAQVEYQDGNAKISADVEKLPMPASLGPYTVYVLWAITPDGRAANQGVIAGFEGGKGQLDTQYGASQFALIVTAEPHFAVTAPSTMITLYNVGDGVKGTESKVTTLTERSDYRNLARITLDDADTIEVLQARYALEIAAAAGAERYAATAYSDANGKLQAAETASAGKRRAERRSAPQLAREAVVAGEDARREAMIASAAAMAESRRLAAAASATQAANETAAIARESTRVATAEERQRTAAANEVNRERAAVAATASARADLRSRLNAALPTRDSARGLVADIGGVNFATGSAELSAVARESIAKFAGIVASYPELKLSVEGHTDNTGSVATNEALSLQRASAVRDYLVRAGLTASNVGVAGFGSSMPTADNATVDGRTRNRRVEIVVSGGPLAAN